MVNVKAVVLYTDQFKTRVDAAIRCSTHIDYTPFGVGVYNDIPFNGRFTIKESVGYFPLICEFYLSAFPGNCGMLVMHNYLLHKPTVHHSELMELAYQYCLALAEQMDYTTLVRTDIEKELVPQYTEMLGRQGWDTVYQFENRRTNNLVKVFMTHLRALQE